MEIEMQLIQLYKDDSGLIVERYIVKIEAHRYSAKDLGKY